jgi:hypothetical protein
MRSHAAAPGKRGGARKAEAKGDAKKAKIFHVETPSIARSTRRLIDAREADVDSQSAGATKLNFIRCGHRASRPR